MPSYNFSLTDLDSDMFSCGYFLHEDVCRFCWTRDATIEIFPNTKSPSTDKPLADKILDTLNINLHTQSHPKRVCDSCANHIETSYSFKKFCLESDKKLKEIFEKRIPVSVGDVKVESYLVESVPILNEHSYAKVKDETVLKYEPSHIEQNITESNDVIFIRQNHEVPVLESDEMTLLFSDNESSHEDSTSNIDVEDIRDVENSQTEENCSNNDITTLLERERQIDHNKPTKDIEPKENFHPEQNVDEQNVDPRENFVSEVNDDPKESVDSEENVYPNQNVDSEVNVKPQDNVSVTSREISIEIEREFESELENWEPKENSSNTVAIEVERDIEKYLDTLEPQENVSKSIVTVEIERDMDSFDNLLSQLHGEDNSELGITAVEIDSKEIQTENIRKLRARSKIAKKENIKTEKTSPKSRSKSSRKNEKFCNICWKDFADIYNVVRHKKSVHKVFEPIKGLQPGETPSNTLKEFCKICSKAFANISKLAKHNKDAHKINDDGKSYMCYGCDKSFETKKQRFNHELRYCKGLKDGYKCPKCDNYLQYRKNLEKHMIDHKHKKGASLPVILFKCKICEKLFETKDTLKVHRSIYHPERKYICETCGRVFARPDYLYKHKLTHGNIRHHKCPDCPYSTVQRSSLVMHMRTHTGDRPYACDQCPQRCVSRSNLNAHKRRHLGMKSHECNLCPKKFANKSSLLYHITHYHERPSKSSKFLECHYCQETFMNKLGITNHIQTKHNSNLKIELEEGLFKINLPPILQNVDYGEFTKFEQGFNEKIGLQL